MADNTLKIMSYNSTGDASDKCDLFVILSTYVIKFEEKKNQNYLASGICAIHDNKLLKADL